MTRRTFLETSAMLAMAAPVSGKLPIHEAVEYSMLPESASIPERFQIARDAGFERIECPTTPFSQIDSLNSHVAGGQTTCPELRSYICDGLTSKNALRTKEGARSRLREA